VKLLVVTSRNMRRMRRRVNSLAVGGADKEGAIRPMVGEGNGRRLCGQMSAFPLRFQTRPFSNLCKCSVTIFDARRFNGLIQFLRYSQVKQNDTEYVEVAMCNPANAKLNAYTLNTDFHNPTKTPESRKDFINGYRIHPMEPFDSYLC